MSAGLVLLVSGLFSQAAAEVEKEPALFALAQEGNGAFWKPRIQWERETPQTPACLVAQAGQVWFQFDPERQKASQAVTARAEETAALVKAFSRHLGEFFGSRAIPFLAGDDEPADPEQAQRWARWRDQWMDRYAARDDGDILPWRHDAHPLREGLRQLEVEILKSMVDEGRSASQGQELKSESTPDSITKKTTSRLGRLMPEAVNIAVLDRSRENKPRRQWRGLYALNQRRISVEGLRLGVRILAFAAR